jgi:hypothetical protein
MTDFEHINLEGPDAQTVIQHTHEPMGAGRACTVEIVPGPRGLDHDRGNADVVITFDDGERRTATFMTIANLTRLIDEKNPASPHDAYVWATNLVVVKSLEPETVLETIRAMMRRGEISLVFGTPPEL